MTSSSEAGAAFRMAKLYRRLECLDLQRDQRIAAASQRLAICEAERDAAVERADREHRATCERCQAGDKFCHRRLAVMPERRLHEQEISSLRRAIQLEADDEEYAARAQTRGVRKEHHIDGFCAYWQNLRHRRFELADNKCERCGSHERPLQAHHIDYERWGFEEIEDVRALCEDCHRRQHPRRY
jgi:HNH endonuclease